MYFAENSILSGHIEAHWTENTLNQMFMHVTVESFEHLFKIQQMFSIYFPISWYPSLLR